MKSLPHVARRLLVTAALFLAGASTLQAQSRTVDTLVADIDATALAVDAGGVLYVATAGRIQRVGSDGSLTPVVGNGTPGFGGDGGQALAAQIGRVPAIDFLPDGDMVFVDADANRVRRVSGGTIATIAGNGSDVHSGDGGPALAAGLEHPNGLAADDDGRLYVSTGHRIRVVADGQIDAHVNASGVAGSNELDMTRPEDVRLDRPEALFFKDDWLYFSDTGNRRILRVSDDWVIAVLGGDWNPGIFEAHGLAIDANYAVVFTQPNRHWVLKDPHHLGNDPYAGSKSEAGFAGDGGPAQDARFSTPKAVATFGETVFVADTGNRRIRRIGPTPLPVPPAPQARPWYSSAFVSVVAWTHPEGTRPLHYEVTMNPAHFGYYQVPINDARDVEIIDLTPGQSYQFYVRAVYDDERKGPWSPPSETIVAVADQQATVADTAVLEGNSGTRNMDFVISIPQPAGMDFDFSFSATVSSSASAADFTETLVNSVIAKGQTSAIVSVPVHGDQLVEGDEDFLVFLGHRGHAAGHARGTILDDDGAVEPQVAAIEDHFETEENAAAQALDVLANDFFVAGSLSGGRLEVATAPLQGSLAVDTNGTAGNAADDRLLYTPRADWAGPDAFSYRFCVSGGACQEALATVQVRMFARRNGDFGHAGRLGGSRSGLRALSALTFDATPLRPLQRHDLQLVGDPRPASPWNDGGTGTQVRRVVLPASATATEWRVYVTAGMPNGHGSNLYLGFDDDGDGSAEAAEVRCVATIANGSEACEAAITLAAGATRAYWVLAHNPSNDAFLLDVYAGAVPMVAGDGTLMATGPATLAKGETFQMLAAYDDPTMAYGDRRIGYVRVRAGGVVLDAVPMTATYVGLYSSALALRDGVPTALRLAAGKAQDRMFIDVPAGASTLTVNVDSDRPVELYLSMPETASLPPRIEAAPARAQSRASAMDAGGEVELVVSGSQLVPGRWYVTPVNAGADTSAMVVTAAIAGAAPVVRPGSYFNHDRSGHGVFLYPAGGEWAGLWYAYRSDGRAAWYYLQGAAPGANGIWTGVLYDSSWQGSANHLVPVGHVTVTPTGADAFVFTHDLNGSTGSEPMAALGRGCPSLGGLPVDASSHWFDPRHAGTGYSVQLWPDYEYYAAFVYDAQGMARFLTAERSGFGGADATLVLEQLHGFSPSQTEPGAPVRYPVGTLRRVLSNAGLSRIVVAAAYTDGVPGAWVGDDDVQTLGGSGTTQGCEP